MCVCECVIDCKPKGGILVALHNVPLFLVCPVRLNDLHILAEMLLDVCIKRQLTELSHMTLGACKVMFFFSPFLISCVC